MLLLKGVAVWAVCLPFTSTKHGCELGNTGWT
jgi:hypothetical protein